MNVEMTSVVILCCHPYCFVKSRPKYLTDTSSKLISELFYLFIYLFCYVVIYCKKFLLIWFDFEFGPHGALCQMLAGYDSTDISLYDISPSHHNKCLFTMSQ